jgi:hypothetical protein
MRRGGDQVRYYPARATSAPANGVGLDEASQARRLLVCAWALAQDYRVLDVAILPGPSRPMISAWPRRLWISVTAG